MTRPRGLETACLLALGAAGMAAGAVILRSRAAAGGTPGWDESSHALQGLVILQDFTHLDLRGLYGDVLGTHFRYPFGHPLLLVAAYAVFGPTWLVAVGVNCALFVAFLLGVFMAARTAATPEPGAAAPDSELPGAWVPLLGGLLAALLGITCPAIISRASTIMLEMPALVLGALFIWLYGRALDRPEEPGRLIAAGWVLPAYVVTASQYATVWLFVVATFEAYRARPEDRRAFLAWLRQVGCSRAAVHPLHVVAVLLVVLAGAVMATGGWTLKLGGTTLSLVHPGTPLTLGLIVAVARGGWLLHRHRARLRASVPARYQALFFSVVLPILVWFFVIYPLRLTHYLNWVTQSTRPLPRSSPEFWIFYPRLLFRSGGLSPIVPLLVLGVVMVGTLERRVPEKIRFLRWGVLWTSIIVILHSARQERFIIPFLPLWLVLVGATVGRGVARLPSRGLRQGAAIAVAGLLLGVVVPAGIRLYRTRVPELAADAFTPESLGYREVLERIHQEALRKPSLRVMGTFPGLSHHVVEWELRRTTDLRKRELAFDLSGEETRKGEEDPPEAALAKWLSEAPEEIVLCLEPIDLAEQLPGPSSEGGSVSPHTYLVMRLLARSDRFTRAGEWTFPASHLRVVEYSLIGERPQPKKRSKHRADR